MGLKSFLKGIAGPVIGLAGDLLGGHSAKKAQQRANEQNIQLQKNQQDWEAQMSNTSYQRAVQDLKAAGLNPILSGTGGMGSHSPSGSMGSASAPTSAQASGSSHQAQAARFENVVAPAVSTALQWQRTKAEIDNINSQTENNRAENPNIPLKGTKTIAETENVNIMTNQVQELIHKTRAETKNIMQQIEQSKEYVELMKKQGLTQEATEFQLRSLAHKTGLEADQIKAILPYVSAAAALDTRILGTFPGEVSRIIQRGNPFNFNK